MAQHIESAPVQFTWQQLEAMTGLQTQFRQELLAQNVGEIEEVDVLGDMQVWWDNFVDSGQIWALGIGAILGYIFKGFTG